MWKQNVCSEERVIFPKVRSKTFKVISPAVSLTRSPALNEHMESDAATFSSTNLYLSVPDVSLLRSRADEMERGIFDSHHAPPREQSVSIYEQRGRVVEASDL